MIPFKFGYYVCQNCSVLDILFYWSTLLEQCEDVVLLVQVQACAQPLHNLEWKRQRKRWEKKWRRCPRAPEEGLHNSRVARQEQMETLCTTRAFPSLKLYQLLFLLCKNGCCAKSLEVTFATASVVGELDKFREKTSTFLEWKKSFCPASLLSGWLLTVLHETWTNWQLGRPTELWWWLNKREGNHSRQESDLR